MMQNLHVLKQNNHAINDNIVQAIFTIIMLKFLIDIDYHDTSVSQYMIL